MKKYIILALIVLGLPLSVFAINETVNRNVNGGYITPQHFTDAMKASYFIASTTATSTFPIASSTCFWNGTACLTSGASLSGGTTNALTYWTSATTVGATTSPVVNSITAASTTLKNVFMGNVGIGTTTIPYKLTVVDSSAFSTTPILKVQGGRANYVALYDDTFQAFNGAAYSGFYFNYFGGDIDFARGAVFARFSDKYVGISDATPNAKLSVNGNAAIGYPGATAPANGLIVSGNVGIGTTSPASKLTVNGHIGTDGVIPTITSAGSSPSITIGSTDTAGEFTEGTIATGAVITFAAAYARAPFCVLSSEAGLLFSYAVASTTITVTNIGALSSTAVTYHCISNDL